MTNNQSTQSQIDFIRDTLVNHIESFRKKRDLNRTKAFRLRMTIVLVGALTTATLGLKPYFGFENSDKILSSVALLLSAIVPVFATWESFFDNRWLWIQYTGTLGSLYAIRDEFEFAHLAGEISKKQLDSIFARIERTLEEIDNSWTKRREHAMNQQTKGKE